MIFVSNFDFSSIKRFSSERLINLIVHWSKLLFIKEENKNKNNSLKKEIWKRFSCSKIFCIIFFFFKLGVRLGRIRLCIVIVNFNELMQDFALFVSYASVTLTNIFFFNKRWLTAIREGGLLDEGGSGKHWKLSCKHNTQRQANRFAAADWDDVEIVAMNHDEICDGTLLYYPALLRTGSLVNPPISREIKALKFNLPCFCSNPSVWWSCHMLSEFSRFLTLTYWRISFHFFCLSFLIFYSFEVQSAHSLGTDGLKNWNS